jgi:hypothetical protein
VDESRVTQVVQALVREDLGAGLEPDSLAELDTSILLEGLGGEDPEGTQKSPPGVDDLEREPRNFRETFKKMVYNDFNCSEGYDLCASDLCASMSDRIKENSFESTGINLFEGKLVGINFSTVESCLSTVSPFFSNDNEIHIQASTARESEMWISKETELLPVDTISAKANSVLNDCQ